MKLIGSRDGLHTIIGRLFDDGTVAPLAEATEFYADPEHWLGAGAVLASGQRNRTDIDEVPAVRPAARVPVTMISCGAAPFWSGAAPSGAAGDGVGGGAGWAATAGLTHTSASIETAEASIRRCRADRSLRLGTFFSLFLAP